MFNHDFENCFEQVLPIILKLKRSFIYNYGIEMIGYKKAGLFYII